MYSNMLLRYRKYLISIEMILLCLIGIISSIQATIIDVPDTADSLRGRTVYTLHTQKRSWKEAREVCRKNGGYLINIGTEEKYQRYLSLKSSQKFRASIGTPWIGLHWRSLNSIHWDGLGCPPPQANLSESYHWKNTLHFKYSASQMCYKEIDDSFQRLRCGYINTFICETYKDDTCRYEDSTITSFTYIDLSLTGAATLDECKSVCDNTTGCFLVSTMKDGCLMLLATDVSNLTIAIKKCYETVEVSEQQTVSPDYSNPTDCATITLSSETVMGIGRASSDESSTGISTITDISTTTLLFTVTSTVTSNYILTDSSTIEDSARSDPTTKIITTRIPLASVVSNIITETTTSSVIITSTETITTGVTQAVGTATTTQTVTVDVTGSRSSTVLYSPEKVPTIEATIQPSFSSLQVNETTASSPTGMKGTIGSDGIMRTLVCHNVIFVTPDLVAEQESVRSIVNDLTVDKKNISAVLQKKISAQDKRPSSVAIGYIGIVFLIIPFLLIIAVDLPTLIRGGRDVIKFCKDEDIF